MFGTPLVDIAATMGLTENAVFTVPSQVDISAVGPPEIPLSPGHIDRTTP